MTTPASGYPKAIDHVGIVVRDLEAATLVYKQLLGADEYAREELPEQGVRAVALRYGDGMVELIAPMDGESGVARFLERRGEGLHHVAYRVPSVAEELSRLRDAGVRLVDSTPRRGLGGRLVAFVHPGGANGVLTELVEPMGGWDEG